MPNNANIFLGLMSGTSLDGLDIAALDFSQASPQLIAAETLAYDEAIASLLKQAILHAEEIDALGLAELDNALGINHAELSAQFIEKHQIDKSSIAAIGSHGHTLLHKPTKQNEAGFSLQIANPNHIAAATGCTVVADFRRADIALGGQGAPLAPAFHEAFLSDENENRIIANIGGIANITLLQGNQVINGFDTGPGNTLMDNFCQVHFNQAYDRDGEIAASGKVDSEFCANLLQDPYFSLSAPKSTGREYFNLAWLEKYLSNESKQFPDSDIIANLCFITAQSLANDCLQYHKDCHRLIVCGGGSHNRILLDHLSRLLPYPVETSADIGIDPDYVEAAAFAWFAKQRLAGIPANLPQVTGASQKCLLGSIIQL